MGATQRELMNWSAHFAARSNGRVSPYASPAPTQGASFGGEYDGPPAGPWRGYYGPHFGVSGIPYGQGPRFGVSGIPYGQGPAFGLTILPATPGDVLAYRSMWDPYVMGMLRAMKSTGDAFVAVSQNPPAGYTAQTLLTYGTSLQNEADALLKLWNLYAGLDSASILLRAGDIVKTYQDVVQRVSKVRVDPLFKQFSVVKKLPSPPDTNVQDQVISRLEGLSLATKGFLQLFSVGAADDLKSVGQATGTIVAGAVAGAGNAIAPVAHSIWEIVPWWVWAAGGVLLVGAGIVVLKASPAGIALRALRGGI
jgi:hypothetical protein